MKFLWIKVKLKRPLKAVVRKNLPANFTTVACFKPSSIFRMAFAALIASSKSSPIRSPLLVNLEEAKGRDAIYVAAVPLRAPRGSAQMLVTTAYSLGAWDLQHFMVIVKPRSTHPQVFFFVFFLFYPVIALISQVPS